MEAEVSDPLRGPLSDAELSELEATLLPALERHHLRLLAHGLRTLQGIAGRREGAPPGLEAIERWALQQPALDGDAPFARALAVQLHGAAEHLAAIAASRGCSPLELELSALIDWARAQADRRVR